MEINLFLFPKTCLFNLNKYATLKSTSITEKKRKKKGIMHSYNPRCLNRWIYKCKTKIPFSQRIAFSELDFRS